MELILQKQILQQFLFGASIDKIRIYRHESIFKMDNIGNNQLYWEL